MKKPCQIDDCSNDAYAKGLCEKHYRRMRRGCTKGYLDKKRCVVPKCLSKIYAKGLCKNHYYQRKRIKSGKGSYIGPYGDWSLYWDIQREAAAFLKSYLKDTE